MSNVLKLPDARHLGYLTFGDPSGRPVIAMHGFPACGYQMRLFQDAARDVGVRLIAPDRPGFGRSDFQPSWRLVDWGHDVAALADHLGLRRFAVIGGSGGAPFALACAAYLPERVCSVAVVSGLGPPDETDIVRKMSRPAQIAFALADRSPTAFRMAYGLLARLMARSPSVNFKINRTAAADQKVLQDDEVRAVLHEAVKRALAQGPAAAQEFETLASPWGFDVRDVRAPIQIWHGREDGVVPYQFAERLAAHAPRADLYLLPDEAHLSVPVRYAKQILLGLVSASDKSDRPDRVAR